MVSGVTDTGKLLGYERQHYQVLAAANHLTINSSVILLTGTNATINRINFSAPGVDFLDHEAIAITLIVYPGCGPITLGTGGNIQSGLTMTSGNAYRLIYVDAFATGKWHVQQ